MPDKLFIGWTLVEQTGSVLFFPPEPLSSLHRVHQARGLSVCPAVQDYERRVFHIRSPYTFRIHAECTAGQWAFYPVYPFTDMPEESLFERIQFQPRSAWRHPSIPVLQMLLPYLCIADEDVFLNQIDAPVFNNKNWSLVSGRFNIYEWQRPINWAIFWTDTRNDLIVRRGDVLFSLLFESCQPQRPISLQAIDYDDQLRNLVESSKDVSKHVRGTFRLFPLQRKKREGKNLMGTNQ